MTDRLLVINCYGDVVEGAKAEVWAKRQKDVLRITAPGYVPRHVAPKKGRPVLLVIDPKTAKGPGLEDACDTNLRMVARWTALGGSSLGDYLGDTAKQAQDRCYFEMAPSLSGGHWMATAFNRTGAFRPVSGKMHKPHEEGFELFGSWKTTRGAPDLQVTLWCRRGDGLVAGGPAITPQHPSYVAELDIDLRTGKGHIYEVARNVVTRGRTNPYLVGQALAWSWGVVPFRLEATQGDSDD